MINFVNELHVETNPVRWSGKFLVARRRCRFSSHSRNVSMIQLRNSETGGRLAKPKYIPADLDSMDGCRSDDIDSKKGKKKSVGVEQK